MAIWLVMLMHGCAVTDDGLPGEPFAGDDSAQRPPPTGTLDLWVEPLTRGTTGTLRATGLAAGQQVSFLGSVAGEGIGPCRNGLCLDLRNPVLLGSARADATGVAELHPNLPANMAPDRVHIQAVAWGPDGVSPVRSVDVTDPQEDFNALVQGTTSMNIGGSLPSQIALWEDRAFPVVVDADGRSLIAAARVNEGRALIAGHETILTGSPVTNNAGADVLMRNALVWMTGWSRGAPGPSPTICIEPGINGIGAWLTAEGYAIRNATVSQLSLCDVWFADLYTNRSEPDDATVRAWIRDGGNLIGGGHAWYWGYSNDNPAENHPGNQVLRETGLFLTEDTTSNGTLNFPTSPISPLRHGSLALDRILAHLDGSQPLSAPNVALASSTVSFTARYVPLTWRSYYDRADEVLDALGPVVPTESNPVDKDAEPLEWLALTLLDAYAQGLPAVEITPHPAANDYPGAVPALAPRISRSLTIDATQGVRDTRYMYSNPSADVWRSTGLYAAPGEIITVTVPPGAIGQGLTVQIGAHSDTLFGKDELWRAPDIARAWPLDAGTVSAASAFGGLVYITVPEGSSLGPVAFTIDGAVEAPWFRVGVDDDTTWLASRGLSAPWAELEGRRITLTVPSAAIRALGNPTALMAFWDAVMDAEADLASISHDRVRSERAVTDRQISAGWMHSGYPFMAHYSSAWDFTNLTSLQANGDWGAFHELGHNHQWSAWHLPGATEATCNLWSVFVMENVVGNPPGHPALDPADRIQRTADYLATGPDFYGAWSVWTNLETWLQLKEGFGWWLIQDMIADFNDDPPASDPTTDQARIDRVATRMGHLAGVNLGPFFLAWGWPLSPAVVTDLGALPPWTNDPMNP